MCLYSVPGPVGSVSSIMDTTSAVILWSSPTYRPRLYPIIRYEIGYHVLQSDNNCSMADANDINLQALTYSNSSSDSSSTTITSLNANTCYIFVVRTHSSRGAGEWRVIANMTLELPQPSKSTVSVSSSLLCKYYCSVYQMLSQQSVQVPLHAVMSVALMTLHLVC